MRLATALVHADDNNLLSDVAAPISVSTTFRAPAQVPSEDFDPMNPQHHVYSRYTQSVSTRVEKVLGNICNGYAITYSSGLASVYAALVHLKPQRIAITHGYHGTHGAIEVYKKSGRSDLPIITLDDDFKAGDVCWLETPLNPTGEARDISYYANKAHDVGAVLVVDSTFAPPPLQDPFKWGADMIMHSGTKYFGGHSDLLCGVLVVKDKERWISLWNDRTYAGNMMGSLESWLLLRSLRTLQVRVSKQSRTATDLVQWMYRISTTPKGTTWDGIRGGSVTKVWHSSLQGSGNTFNPKVQLEGGYNPTFAVMLANPDLAASLPFAVKLFVPATSLGGVESLMEQRVRSDPSADPRVIRISVGVEDLEDLKEDLRNALNAIMTRSKL